MGRIGKRRGLARKRGSRKIKMSGDTRAIIERQLEAFRKKFGRDPEPDDPIFFNPDADEPVLLNEEEMMKDVLAGFAKAGLPPQHAYAYHKTERLLMEGVEYPPEAVAEWNAAIEEYFELEKAGKLKPKS